MKMENSETSTTTSTMECHDQENPVENEEDDGSDKQCDDESINDPYAYLDRNEFTSEKFKIEIRNLPKYYGMKELKRLINNKLKLNSTKIKVPSLRSPWIYVTFRSEEDKANALKVLNNYKWKNSNLTVDEAKPVPDPLVQKRIQNSHEDEPSNKKIKLGEGELLEKMKDATTPLWRLTYEQQLKGKMQTISGLLRGFGYKLAHTNPGISKWWTEQKSKYSGMPCELLPFRSGPLLEGYRNKCEFTAGINEDTGEKTVGFRLCSYAEGSVSVAPIDDALNVPERMKIAVAAFQKFIQNSHLEVFNPELHKGCWKQLTARYGFKTDQLMLIVGINPKDMTESDLSELKDKIKEYFTVGEGKSCNVTSLYLLHITKKKSHDDEPVQEHVFGETNITEELLGRTFRISPQAFFQVNTHGAEILYEAIGELAGLTPDVSLLDVCCGTGSIGICLSDKCGEVVGLELSPEAIADAQENASSNKVTNAQFFAGKAEEILSCVAQKCTKNEIVAIVDPPRAGLRQDALVQLRKCERINKLVYVSCNPRGAVKNFVDLGRASSKIYKGQPFLPVKAIPIDLFPLTPHFELLIYFERKPV